MKTPMFAAVAAALVLSSCATAPEPVHPPDAFMARLQALCGQRFEGRVVSTDAADADFRGQRLVMHVRELEDLDLTVDTLSVGLRFSFGGGLLKRADEGVYEAKSRGRNQVIARAA